MIPFAPLEWDRSRNNPNTSDVILNVLPTKDGYRPFPSLATYSEALLAACRGGIIVHQTDGSYVLIVFTAANAYKLNVDQEWDEIGSGFTLADGDFWSVVAFGTRVIATNVNDGALYYDIGVSATFAALPNAPDQFRYAVVSGDYLLLLSTSAQPNLIWRSGINDTEWWTPKQRGSDFQVLPDGGWIVGAAGYERGAVIFSETTIRAFEDAPGAPWMFTLAKTEPARGAIASKGIVQVGNRIFYLAEDGFFQFGVPESRGIGAERVDRRFFNAEVELDDLPQVQGAADPVNQVVMWLYTTANGDRKILGYNWQLDRWFSAETEATYLISVATPARHLDVAATDSDPLDIDTEGPSFDSRIWKGGRPEFGAFNGSNELGFFNGPNLEATLETADLSLGGEGLRGFCNGFRPVGVSGAYGRVLVKETLDEEAEHTELPEWPQDVTGMIPARASGRTARFRVRIPYGTIWRMISGLELNKVKRAGRR